MSNDKVKEMTEYLVNTISLSFNKPIGFGDYGTYKNGSNFLIKKFSELLNLPIEHFEFKNTPEDFLNYLQTGNIEIGLSDEAKKRYLNFSCPS